MKKESEKGKSLRLLPVILICVVSVAFLVIEYQVISFFNRQEAYQDADALIRKVESVLRGHKAEENAMEEGQRAVWLQTLIADMPTTQGVELLVADRAGGVILAATQAADVGATLEDIGLGEQPPHSSTVNFPGEKDGKPAYFSLRGSDRQIIVVQERSAVDRGIPAVLFSVFLYLVIVALGIGLLLDHMTTRLTDEHKNANTDRLTGLPNRRAYEDELLRLRHNAELERKTVVSLDLNGLKTANDTRGHEMGDALIQGMAENMIEAFHQYGKMYRTGGDEFMALLEIEEKQLQWAIESFQERNALWTQVHNYVLSVALGYVRAADHPELDPQELARLADQAMYEDKARYYRSSGHDRRTR